MLRRPIGALIVLLAVLSAATVGSAAPKRDAAAQADVERLEVAREHFQKAEELAKAGQLEAAIVELDLADVAHPSPTFTEARQRLRAQLDAKRAQEVPTIVAAPAPAPESRSLRLRRFIAPIVVAPLALGALVAGGALLGVVRSDVRHLQSSCSPACDPSDVDPLRSREKAAYGLLAAGAVLAATDALLWGLLARRPASTVRASTVIVPRGGGLVLEGTF